MGKRINILVLSCALDTPGGVAAFIRTLVRQNASEIEYEHFSIGARPDAASGIFSLLRPLLDGLHLFALLRRKHFDGVHINPSLNPKSLLRDGFYLLMIHGLGIRNTFVFFHGWSQGTQKAIQEHKLLQRLFRCVFAGAGIIGVLSARFREALLQIGFTPAKIHVYSTMFEPAAIDPGGGSAGLPCKNNNQLLFMSRLVQGKGCRETLQAFRLLSAKFPDLELVIAGDGPERQRLIDWSRRWGLDDRVRFPGYLRAREKAAALNAAGILIFPTFYGEGCPVILLEAMAAGMGIVTTRDGGIPDIVDHEKNGILLDDSDPRRIARAVETLLSDQSRLEAMQAANYRKAWNCFEAGVVSRRIELVYAGWRQVRGNAASLVQRAPVLAGSSSAMNAETEGAVTGRSDHEA